MLKKPAPWYIWPAPRVLPELNLFETTHDCMAAWRKVALKGTVGVLVPVVTLLVTLAAWLLLRSHGLWVCLLPFLLLLTSQGTLWLFRERMQRSLRRELVMCGIPVCLNCGYNLRGQVESRCPECGLEFDKKLLQDENQSG